MLMGDGPNRIHAVYRIIEAVTGRGYTGSTVHCPKRKQQHWNYLRDGVHHSRRLQDAWDKYGESAFEFTIVEFVNDPGNLIDREQYWLDHFRDADIGYNICRKAGSSFGTRRSIESKTRMSEAQKGRKHSAESRAKMSASRMGNKYSLGHKWSEEALRKRSAWLTGRRHGAETKAKMSAAKLGKKCSAEQRANMSAAKKRLFQNNPELRAKIGSKSKGRVYSAEARAKISASQRARRALEAASRLVKLS